MAGTSSSSNGKAACRTRGHRKLGIVENPVQPGTEPDPDDSRNLVLAIDGYRELAHCKLDRAYFQEITDDTYEIGAVEYELPQNRFQCHLLHSLFNLSPVLHLLGDLLRKHGLYPCNWKTLGMPTVEELIKVTGITWNEKLEFAFDDSKREPEWTPALKYKAALKDESDLDVDGKWGRCDEVGLLRATLEAFREAFKYPFDEANPVAKRLKSALTVVAIHGAHPTHEPGLDVHEFLRTRLFDQDGRPRTLADDVVDNNIRKEVLKFDRMLTAVRIARYRLEAKGCPCGGMELGDNDHLLGKSEYAWSQNIESTEEANIEDLIANKKEWRVPCPGCKAERTIDTFPRMLYPPEVWITTHKYQVNEQNDGKKTIGSLRFPEYLDLSDVIEPDEDPGVDGDDGDDGDEDDDEELEKLYRLQAVISCNWIDADDDSKFAKEYRTDLRRAEGKWTRIEAPGHQQIDAQDVTFKDVVYQDDFRPVMLFWVRDRKARKSDLARCNRDCAKDIEETASEEIVDADGTSSEGEPEFNEDLDIQLRPELTQRAAVVHLDGYEVRITSTNPRRGIRTEDVLATGEREWSEDEDDGPDSGNPPGRRGAPSGRRPDHSAGRPGEGGDDDDDDDDDAGDGPSKKRKKTKLDLVINAPDENDTRFEKSESEDWTLKRLKVELRLEGIRQDGKTAVVFQRWRDHFNPPESGRDYDNYTGDHLRERLRSLLGRSADIPTYKPSLAAMAKKYDTDRIAEASNEETEDEEEEEGSGSGSQKKKRKSG